MRPRRALFVLLIYVAGVLGTGPASARIEDGVIAFLARSPACHCRGIYTASSDGSGRRLLSLQKHAGVLEWSPDASKLAFRGYPFAGHLYVMNADGSSARDISGYSPGGLDGYVWDFAWAPDSESLAFSFGDEYGVGEDLDIRTAIFRVNADGSGLRQLTDAEHDNRHVAWSPSGDRIAFYSNRDGAGDIYTMTPDGLDVQQLTTAPEGVQARAPAWSPDGSRIFFTRDRLMGKNALKSMAQDGSQEMKVLSLEDYASWELSPGGDEVLIVQVDWETKFYQLFVARTDGTGALRRITNTQNDKGNAQWSPSGSTIAFDTYRRGKGSHLVLMTRDGSTSKRVVGEREAWGPAWQPPG
jgi:TolB protein